MQQLILALLIKHDRLCPMAQIRLSSDAWCLTIKCHLLLYFKLINEILLRYLLSSLLLHVALVILKLLKAFEYILIITSHLHVAQHTLNKHFIAVTLILRLVIIIYKV